MILSSSWAMEEFDTIHDEFLKNVYGGAIREAHPNIPDKFEPEEIPIITKKMEKIYKNYFKNSVINQLEKYFKNYEYDVSSGLQILIDEINQEKISFKNIKSKLLYYIENDDQYKKEDDQENIYSTEAQVTIEDL